MHNPTGPFYYPFPANKKVRMFVKREADEIWFRLDDADDEKLWEEHGWVPWSAIEQAVKMYSGREKESGFDPRVAYDLPAAKLVLADGREQ